MECKDNIAGVKSVFLSDFEEFPKYFFLQDEIVFEFQTRINITQLNTVTASQNFSNSLWSQTLKINVPKLINEENISIFERNTYRAIILDNNGDYWVLGAQNGIVLNTINSGTGGSKSEFSGYELNFEGKELKRFTKITDVSGFISDLRLYLTSSSLLTSVDKLISDKYEQ